MELNDNLKTYSYESMGTRWAISCWDDISEEHFSALAREVFRRSQVFDETYSRFKPMSLVWELSKKTGRVSVPKELTELLSWYGQLYRPSHMTLNPLIGFAISDLGYDANYSLKRKDVVRPVPDFLETIRIIDDETIELRENVLIDLGALGKGYFVDKIYEYLEAEGVKKFLVDGSGDIRYSGGLNSASAGSSGAPRERLGEPIRAGLEDPNDPKKAIGVLEMTSGALCASAGNRRRWGNQTHIVNPFSLESPHDISAVWVKADLAVLADALATCLFFVDPEAFGYEFSFEYLILDSARRVKRSGGFNAQLF